MPKASDLKKGQIVEVDGNLYSVKNIDVKAPSSRGANTLYKVRFSQLKTGQKMEQTLTGDDMLTDVNLSRRQGQFLYKDDDTYTFMDQEDYNQYYLNNSDIEDEINFLTDGLEGLMLLLVDGALVGLELPSSVSLEIIETAPAIKGASASARTKPATLSTGFIVQIPEYLATGEVIKVNTSTGKFMSRA